MKTKPLVLTMLVSFLLAGCGTAVPISTPSATPLLPTSTSAPSPTATPLPPTATNMPSPTQIPAPTFTFTPPPIPTLSGSGGGVIAFLGSARQATGSYFAAIYLINADGSGLYELTTPADGRWLSPAWSPDGMRIVFYSHVNYNVWSIFVVNADGSHVQRLTTSETRDENPSWSPDGSQVAFCRDGDLWVMQVSNGQELQVSNLRPLTSTPDEYENAPVWSPDGTRIAFTSIQGGSRADDPNFDPTNIEIYVMNADGANLRQLTDNDFVDDGPDWSPDGQRIAFYSNRDGNYQIYVMGPDSRNPQRLTDNDFNDASPAWSPDGTRIVFNSDRDGAYEVYVMNSDGSNQIRLTKSAMDKWGPIWRPEPAP